MDCVRQDGLTGNTIEVDGVPRHVLDIRCLFLNEESDKDYTDEPGDVIAQEAR